MVLGEVFGKAVRLMFFDPRLFPFLFGFSRPNSFLKVSEFETMAGCVWLVYRSKHITANLHKEY